MTAEWAASRAAHPKKVMFEMKRKCIFVLIGLACGWLLAILSGRNVGPGCPTHMRLRQVRWFVDEIKVLTTIDEIERRIGSANELMSKWKNPYKLELKDGEEGLFLLASPKYKAMYNLEPWAVRILFLNFSKFEFPTMKEKIGQAEHGTGPRPEARGR